MVTQREAIKNFLEAKTHADLASIYTPNMEVQVNVAQDDGVRIDGDYQGRRWTAWTDHIETWKSFRIPYKAKTEPEYQDKKMSFDLERHAEGIGLTGWDYVNRVSKWVGYDFDAIMGHAEAHEKKLTDIELRDIQTKVKELPFVTTRLSTSGTGLHLYVFLPDVPTSNHTEHAALARAILGMMSAVTGYDFESKVDACGNVLWFWHRKMVGTDGLKLVKRGGILEDIPNNWKDHINVVSGKKKKTIPEFIAKSEESGVERLFDELSGQRTHVELDEEHRKLIDYLNKIGAQWAWNQDQHMLICHTYDLFRAHKDLGFRGVFKTLSQGREQGQDQNAFAYPLRRGGWVVRRYTPGVAESETWEQDGSGWTKCYLNTDPNLKVAARANKGIENPKGGFVFTKAEDSANAAKLLGVNLNIPDWAWHREITFKEHKDGRLIVELERKDNDNPSEMSGWLPDKKLWKKIFNIKVSSPSEPEIGNYDDIIRHLVSETGEDLGWMLKNDGKWRAEPLTHIRAFIKGALSLTDKESNKVIGSCVAKCWTMVNWPFQPEYVGDRRWNRGAAQIRFLPTENTDNLNYPTWLSILEHCGEGLNEAIAQDNWCKANGITSGADYLKCWIASLFQEPNQPLPYLFLFSPEQNTGKSILHEGLSLLMTSGVVRSDNALMNQGNFNGELENAVLCVVEETDLNWDKRAYNKIKDWVTSPKISIHIKGRTPYDAPNTTHWIHCANSIDHCPVFSGDSRITMSEVSPLDPLKMVPKKDMLPKLEKEAPDFLAAILNLELPPSNDRLNVPVITTEQKKSAENSNMSFLDMFLREETFYVSGEMIKVSEFYDAFQQWLDPRYRDQWSKIKMNRNLPKEHPKGRCPKTGQFHIGNISWEPKESNKPPLFLKDDKLVPHATN